VSHSEGKTVENVKAKAKAKDVPDDSVIDEVMEELHPTVPILAQKPVPVPDAFMTRDAANDIVGSLTQE